MSQTLKSRHKTHQREDGVVIVMGAIWLTSFLVIMAVAIDTVLIVSAVLKVDNAAGYVALATLRTFKDPPINGTYGGSSELDRYNFAVSRGELAGKSSLLMVAPDVVISGDLNIRYAYGLDDYDEASCNCGYQACPNVPYNPCGGGTGVPGSGHPNDWCGFEPTTQVGDLIFGHWKEASAGSPGTFTPANVGQAPNTINAVTVTLRLRDASTSSTLLPFWKMLMGEAKMSLHSTAIAYRNDTSLRYSLVN